MTDLDLIMQAVTTGAGVVASAAAAPAMEDAYAALKARIRHHLAGRRVALEQLDSRAPDSALLREHLARTPAATDPEVHELAEKLLNMVDARPVNHGTVSINQAPHSINPAVHHGNININHVYASSQPQEQHRPPTPAAKN